MGKLSAGRQMKRILKIGAAMLVLIFAVSTGYWSGFYTGRHSAVEATLTVPPGAPSPASDVLGNDFKTLREAWAIVDSEYVDPTKLDKQNQTYGAISGMLSTLGDPHTVYSPPAAARISDDDLRGSFEGIGAELEVRDGKITVVAPIEGTPAERAGIAAGDRIIEIDGIDATTMSLTDAIARIRGPKGSSVRLTVARGTDKSISFTIFREEIRPVNVRASIVGDRVGYLKLTTFTEKSGTEVKDALEGLKAKGARAIILDLRNNPGGLLAASVDVSSQFLADGVVLVQSRRDSEPVAYRARPGGSATAMPLVVLVNRGSASASEIVAGALQDSHRAVLIGERTFGKDTVQNVHGLSDGSSVRITVSRWYTPDRQEIHGVGLKPDIEVPLTDDDRNAHRDPQLDVAIRSLGTRN